MSDTAPPSAAAGDGVDGAADGAQVSSGSDGPDADAGAADALHRRVVEALAFDGTLAVADPGFRPRDVQDRMALAVAQALQTRGTLVVEAGTGVGKTFAYLVPLLLSGRRGLVSTATKALQDQLFLRDLPRLRDALGVPARLALLKGRSNYLCRWRLQQAGQDAPVGDRFAQRALARIEAWAVATRTGDLAEVTGLDERSPVIPLVTSTRENCLGSDCPEWRACHVVQARREAMAADLVVVNHHLFFADLALRDSGVAELLPTVEAVVFDEAHQLVETGVQFLGTRASTPQWLDYGRDALAAGLKHARGLQPWVELQAALERAAREVRLACGQRGGGGRYETRLPWLEVDTLILPPLREVQLAAAALAAACGAVAEVAPELAKLQQRGSALAAVAARFAEPLPDDHVRWAEVGSLHLRLVESPLDIRRMLGEQREAGDRSWIFTSATLGDDDALTWFTGRTGLEDAALLRLGSPFDYAAHARVWVPQDLPLPNETGHAQAVGALAARCAAALGGRVFVLTTTLRALALVAAALDAALRARPDGAGIEVLVQGAGPRRALLQRYGDGVGRVLLGSQSFWEGIDMPGDALQCVVIDKLPFPPPDDPLVQARVRQLRAQGREPFLSYFVAEAAVSLKQGAGRLIRSEEDLGLLVLCDPRLRRMGYGRRLLAALPPMTRIDTEVDAMAWLGGMASRHGWGDSGD